MKVVVKLGGTLLDAPESRSRLAREIVEFAGTGALVAVVHGGGRQMTRFLAERKIESRFVNGLRVTTPEVLDAVLKVLGGVVNYELVAAFVAAGARAVGLSGLDAGTTVAEPTSEELGAVGRPVASDGTLLNLLAANGFLPVVACIGGDAAGRIYNVNADQMAIACASGFQANRLFFLTDVEGVRVADGSTAAVLTRSETQQLIDSGVATGGMRAKLEAAGWALDMGVDEVVIAPGAQSGIVARLAVGEPAGTRIVRGAREEVK